MFKNMSVSRSTVASGRGSRPVAASVLAVGLALSSACSDDEPVAEPAEFDATTTSDPTAQTTAPTSDTDTTGTTIDLRDRSILEGEGGLPLPLDEDSALACANAQASLYRMRGGDLSIAADQTSTARTRAAASSDRRFSDAASLLDVDLDDDAWEPSVRAFLEICRSAGYKPL